MRNALYNGQATQWLKKQAQNPFFLNLVKLNESEQNGMRDREIINRFCGFYLLGVEKYPDDDSLDKFLASTLKYMNEEMDEEQLFDLANRFETSMKNNYSVFGEYTFRKHTSQKERRNPFNVAIFDVFSVYLADYSESKVINKAEKIHQGFYRLMKDEKFLKHDYRLNKK